MNTLSVLDLSIGYHKALLPPINFDLLQGELVSIIGVNGIGKSTLIKSIAGMIPVLGGNITFGTSSIKKKPRHALAKEISLVLTESISSKSLTVEEVVSLGRYIYTNKMGRLRPMDTRIIETAMTQTSIIHLRDKKCYEISDGQLQCVMIAKALAQDTPIVILDEPTSYLDNYHKIRVLKLLKKLAKKTQKSILISSHEVNLCLQLSEKILLMTPCGTSFGSVEQLVDSNAFNDIFPDDLIRFDSKCRRFIMK